MPVDDFLPGQRVDRADVLFEMPGIERRRYRTFSISRNPSSPPFSPKWNGPIRASGLETTRLDEAQRLAFRARPAW